MVPSNIIWYLVSTTRIPGTWCWQPRICALVLRCFDKRTSISVGRRINTYASVLLNLKRQIVVVSGEYTLSSTHGLGNIRHATEQETLKTSKLHPRDKDMSNMISPSRLDEAFWGFYWNMLCIFVFTSPATKIIWKIEYRNKTKQTKIRVDNKIKNQMKVMQKKLKAKRIKTKGKGEPKLGRKDK